MAEIYSSLFKGNVHVTTPFKSTHKAIDLGNYKTRNAIYSPNKLGAGTVSYVATSYTDSAGKAWVNSLVVYIKYDNGMTSRHFHGYVADKVVNKGDRVSVGQQVYRTGNSGNSVGDHLHYVLLNSSGVAIDPAPYVLGDAIVEPPQPPQPTPCEDEVKRLQGVVTGLEGTVKQVTDTNAQLVIDLNLAKERVGFLEGTLAIRQEELVQAEEDIAGLKTSRDYWQAEHKKVVTELNELKAGRDTWINRIADILHNLFNRK